MSANAFPMPQSLERQRQVSEIRILVGDPLTVLLHRVRSGMNAEKCVLKFAEEIGVPFREPAPRWPIEKRFSESGGPT